MNTKDFLFLALSISMLSLCGLSYYCLIQQEKERLNEKHFQAQLNQAQLQITIDKKKRLTQHYKKEFELAWFIYLNPNNTPFQKDQADNMMTRIKNEMLQDEFDRAEIGEMFRNACTQGKQYYNQN